MITREEAKKLIEDRYPKYHVLYSYEDDTEYEFGIEKWNKNDSNLKECFDRVFTQTIDKETGEFTHGSITDTLAFCEFGPGEEIFGENYVDKVKRSYIAYD